MLILRLLLIHTYMMHGDPDASCLMLTFKEITAKWSDYTEFRVIELKYAFL